MRLTLRPALVPIAALATTAALGVPAQATTPAEGYAAAAVGATNAQRAGHGLVLLRRQACLQRFATGWARRMAATERLVHQPLVPVMRRCGLSMVGENIASGFPAGGAAVHAWMESPGHRANVLRQQFRLIAVGAARDDHGRWWSSQVLGRR